MKRNLLLSLMLCLTLLCMTQCKKEAPTSIKMSETTITLSSETKEAKVKVTSNVDWICSGGDKVLGIPIMTLDWIEIEPYASKAGSTDMLIRLIDEKAPDKEASLSIKLEELNGSATASLTVKYKP